MKAIIFFGDVFHSADDKFNEWTDEHQDIEIVKVVYQQAGNGRTNELRHSICVFYKEK